MARVAVLGDVRLHLVCGVGGTEGQLANRRPLGREPRRQQQSYCWRCENDEPGNRTVHQYVLEPRGYGNKL